ncbi:FAD synthase [Eumeta japonica]|uniref:FAD synthase n=1 Tax=Eumeta variegata TaxID=151549 RepID=A0A4C1W778_EUMVA|nr:FAD synthase [Eumeta japonica]
MTVEGDMKYALERILNGDKRLKASFMGTRKVDPHGADLNFMQETDANWPRLMRVSPLLNWSYHQIWSYIHARKVPYCQLYDKGYTSIGSILNTRPNPALVYTDSSNRISYLPAWKLKDPSQERAGRLVNGHNQNSDRDHDHDHSLINGNSHNKEHPYQNLSDSNSFQRNCL